MPDDELRDLGAHRYLAALADEVDAGVAERPSAAARPVRRRLPMLAAAAAGVAVVAAGLVVVGHDDPASVDTTGEGTSSSTTVSSTTVRPSDAALQVVPSTGLADGDIVELRIDRPLSGTDIAQCTGDFADAGLASSCDLDAVIGVDGEHMIDLKAADGLRVSVSRVIHVTGGSGDPNVSRPYDCATEPAGCVLAVGDALVPAVDLSAPLEFVPGPRADPVLTLEPSTGVRDGDEVTVSGRGLRPNGVFFLTQCAADLGEALSCDDEYREVRTDRTGTFSAEVRVAAVVYGYQGRTDCVSTACTIRILDPTDGPQTGPIGFAPGTVAAIPTLTVSPPGPYVDQQAVTLRGTGFPPGRDLSGQVGQCPAHLDTAVEERCGYNASVIGGLVVGADGTFETDVTLFESLSTTGTCVGSPGCVLAWVIPHGPMGASIPISFSD